MKVRITHSIHNHMILAITRLLTNQTTKYSLNYIINKTEVFITLRAASLTTC